MTPPRTCSAVKPGDRKIGGEVGVVTRQEHPGEFHVLLVDLRNLVGGMDGPEMRAVRLGIGGIGINVIERDFVLVDIGIVQCRLDYEGGP